VRIAAAWRQSWHHGLTVRTAAAVWCAQCCLRRQQMNAGHADAAAAAQWQQYRDSSASTSGILTGGCRKVLCSMVAAACRSIDGAGSCCKELASLI
jgi:phage protein D